MNKKKLQEFLNKLPNNLKKKIILASKSGKKVKIKIQKKKKDLLESPYRKEM